MSGNFRVGEAIVRTGRRSIERGNQSTQVKPKSMSVLQCLLAARGEPVSRGELLDAVWPGQEVTDDVLTKCIAELRSAFGDSARESRVIQTIPKLGFRLIPTVEELATAPQGGNRRRWVRPLGLLIALLLLAIGLLSFNTTRLWLIKTGTTLFITVAAALFPYQLEQKPGIAVLPFVNFSGDPENEYFTDGMSVEIINTLARANRLPVTAQNSSFEFKNNPRDVREVGRLLGVTHVLEGSVRKSGEEFRLTVQLIDATTGAHIWSGIYQRELGDIFDLQVEIAGEIVDQIYAAFGDRSAWPVGEPGAIALRPASRTENLEAYDLYLRGMQMLRSNNPLPIEQSIDYFDRAIALDGNYADAWAAKGVAYYTLGRPGYGHPHVPATVYPRAIAAFRRALEIEPGHATATGWLGVTLIVNDYQWAEGMRMMEESLARNPNDAELWSVYAMHLRFMRLEGAEEALHTSLRLDPYSPIYVAIHTVSLLQEGRYLEAATLVEMLLANYREGYATNYLAAITEIMLGRLEAAEEHLRKARQVAHPGDLSLDALEWVMAIQRGSRSEPKGMEILEQMRTRRVSNFLLRGWVIDWEDTATIVAAYDLAIEQRHPEVRGLVFGPRPELMPRDEWRRIRERTGVTRYLQDREAGVSQ